MTQKYYDNDAYKCDFDATVLSCEPTKNGYLVCVDGTCFFPEEGGQKADKGVLGGLPVWDVQIKEGDIFHLVPFPLHVGSLVHGCVDFKDRYRKMQSHSGEHIVSGLIYNHFHLNNVGFHLGNDEVTLDVSGELTQNDLHMIEDLANRVIFQNIDILCEYPSAEVLKHLEYRSKLALEKNVRIVTIPGVDACACCAPHVAKTGEIGMIKLLESIRYKGGMRIHMLCGEDALRDYRQKHQVLAASSALMSVKQHEVDQGIQRLLCENEELKEEIRQLTHDLVEETANHLPNFDSVLCLFPKKHALPFWRDLAMYASSVRQGVIAVFLEDDAQGYSYVAASNQMSLKPFAAIVNQKLSGRGGGNERMIQGNLRASAKEITEVFQELFS